jgi:hypothetical protein
VGEMGWDGMVRAHICSELLVCVCLCLRGSVVIGGGAFYVWWLYVLARELSLSLSLSLSHRNLPLLCFCLIVVALSKSAFIHMDLLVASECWCVERAR